MHLKYLIPQLHLERLIRDVVKLRVIRLFCRALAGLLATSPVQVSGWALQLAARSTNGFLTSETTSWQHHPDAVSTTWKLHEFLLLCLGRLG